jgi:hypothetical protein
MSNKQILKNMKNQKKQTAVEWIEDSIQLDMTIMEVLGLIRQAKEMEKDMIIETSKNSYITGYLDNQAKVDDSNNFPEEYYNETFNTKEK